MSLAEDFDQALADLCDRAQVVTELPLPTGWTRIPPAPVPVVDEQRAAAVPLTDTQRQRLEQCMGLVHFVVHDRMGLRGADADDAIQDGVMGLARAIQADDQATAFTTYAIYRIRGEVLRGLAARSAQRDLLPPRPEDRAGWTRRRMIPLDTPVGAGDDLTLADVIPGDGPPPEVGEHETDLRAAALLAALCDDDLDRALVANILDRSPLSLAGLAAELGHPQMTVLRRHHRLVSRLTHPSISDIAASEIAGYQPPAFHADAACREHPAAVFADTGRPKALAAARAVCDGCLVRTECLTAALADPTLVGVLGGTSRREREVHLGIRGRERSTAGRCGCGAPIPAGSTARKCGDCRRARPRARCTDCDTLLDRPAVDGEELRCWGCYRRHRWGTTTAS